MSVPFSGLRSNVRLGFFKADVLISEISNFKDGIHLIMQGDLCEKEAIEAVFDIHRYATKPVVIKLVLHWPLYIHKLHECVELSQS